MIYSNKNFEKIKKIAPKILAVFFLLFVFFYPTIKKFVEIKDQEIFSSIYQSIENRLPEPLSETQNAWNDLNLSTKLYISNEQEKGYNWFKDSIINKSTNESGNITDIWRDLGIKSDLCFCEYYEDDKNYADKNNYCKTCNYINSIEMVEVPKNSSYMIFRYGFNYWDYQYLVFIKNIDSKWEFLGNIDLAIQKYEEPTNIIVQNDHGTWLVIKALTQSGSGIVSYSQKWYWLGEQKTDGIVESLSYPVEGHLIGWNPLFDRRYFSERFYSGTDELKITFYALYTNARKDDIKDLNELFFIQKDAVYVWNSKTRHFVINQANSQITQDQIEGLYTDGNDGFLIHNFAELQKFADIKYPANQKWLQIFLNECKNSPQKAGLLK